MVRCGPESDLWMEGMHWDWEKGQKSLEVGATEPASKAVSGLHADGNIWILMKWKWESSKLVFQVGNLQLHRQVGIFWNTAVLLQRLEPGAHVSGEPQDMVQVGCGQLAKSLAGSAMVLGILGRWGFGETWRWRWRSRFVAGVVGCRRVMGLLWGGGE